MLRTAQVAVDAITADVLAAASSDDTRSDYSVLIKNPAGSGVTAFVGGADVTAATGFPLEPGAVLTAELAAGEDLFAITAAGTVTLAVLRQGVT